MSSTASFPRFSLLPAELQIQIWKEALAPVAVLSLYMRRQTGGGSGGGSKQHGAAQPPQLAVALYGAKPHKAGLSCKTARVIMEETYVTPLRRLASANACWVNLDRAVLHISEPMDTAKILDALEPADLPRIRHIALAWRSEKYGNMVTACKAIAARCRNLATLTFNPYYSRYSAQECRCRVMDEQITAFYAAIPDYTESPWWDFSMDLLQARSRLLPYFKNPRPKMHLVPFHVVNCDPE
ncbi:hypothetical protein PpBr36_07605 [Pyricularia pennisetigena]|uniref:hypothetical protein n=1 Tax=Pyricularia pennisetigena TaxID=1578925 RepID=UPI001150B48A|nr:hypothetical protein PpBr36_07605 [Pyricularia pennisetigena]TLS25728.1 hypothetical protein PpBr36_07605 [Pyricularia pennisetigena]